MHISTFTKRIATLLKLLKLLVIDNIWNVMVTHVLIGIQQLTLKHNKFLQLSHPSTVFCLFPHCVSLPVPSVLIKLQRKTLDILEAHEMVHEVMVTYVKEQEEVAKNFASIYVKCVYTYGRSWDSS